MSVGKRGVEGRMGDDLVDKEGAVVASMIFIKC
jgi:hypothetical protein